MKSINSLSKDAQEIIFELSDGNDNTFGTAECYINVLCESYVVSYYGWEHKQNAIKEVLDFFDGIVQLIERVSNLEVEIHDRKDTFKNAIEECGISDFEEDICTAAIKGNDVECVITNVARQIRADFDDFRVPVYFRI